ncbi:GntR family transcriptional regulator [Escherichia coli]|nr:GntR family transcriptional regulator [Escherichia coli]
MHLSTHPTSYPTRYQEIAAKLEQELRQHYRCGDYLPAEQQLAARFEVNRHTLRRAIDQLVEKGWVQRRQGVGVLVLMRPFDYPLNAQAKECQRLEIPNMSPLLCVRTLNHRDGESSPAEYSVSLTRADMIEFTMEH